jgi:hypothetical protein
MREHGDERFAYGHTLVEVFAGGFVRTTLPDGTVIHAAPGDTPEDKARARSLGYEGDVWAMTRDHDRFHALLAHAFGLEESPALRATARGEQSELAGAEECAVLAIQRWANLCREARLL